MGYCAEQSRQAVELAGLSSNLGVATWENVQNNPAAPAQGAFSRALRGSAASAPWDWGELSTNEFNFSESFCHVKAKILQQSFFPVVALKRRREMVVSMLENKKLYNGAIVRTVLSYL